MSTNPNRRAILAGAATLPATALPAIATEADPVFAAIEAHRRASKALTAFLETNDDWDGPEGTAMTDAEFEEFDDLLDAPTTAAGVAALLRHTLEVAEELGLEGLMARRPYADTEIPWGEMLLEKMARALDRVAGT